MKDDSSSEAVGEAYPILGNRRASHARGCALTVCVTVLVLCAAVAIVLVSVLIAHRQQVSAELLLEVGNVAADFAFWNPAAQALFWVDRERNEIHRYDVDTNTTDAYQFSHEIGVVMPRLGYNDSVLMTSGDYVAFYNLTTRQESVLTYFGNGTLFNTTSFTDARCDPYGSMWVGASGEGDLVPSGSLYQVHPSQSITTVLYNISTPGGMAWSQDRKTFFFIDSKNSKVDAYSYDPNSGIAFQRIAFYVPTEYGTPSGMAIDETDSLWIAIIGPSALNGTGRVCRYDAYLGQLQETVLLPVSQVTSCVFGGPNLAQLFITTRRKIGEKNSGGIFVANRLGVVGAAPSLYAG